MGKGKRKGKNKGKGNSPPGKNPAKDNDEKPPPDEEMKAHEVDEMKKKRVSFAVLKEKLKLKMMNKDKANVDKKRPVDKGDKEEEPSLKRRIELPSVEASVQPLYGLQPLVLSDDQALAVSCIRAKALLMSGVRLKHLQQSPIVTVLLDSMTVSCLRARWMHLKADFHHFGPTVEQSSVYSEVIDQLSIMRLSNASTVRTESIGVCETHSGDRLYTVSVPFCCPEQRGSERAKQLIWKQGDDTDAFTNRWILTDGNENRSMLRYMGTQVHSAFASFVLMALSHQMPWDTMIECLSKYYFEKSTTEPAHPDRKTVKYNYRGDLSRWLVGLKECYEDFLSHRTIGQQEMLSRMVGWSTLNDSGAFVSREGMLWDDFDDLQKTNTGWCMGLWAHSAVQSWFTTQAAAEQRNHSLRWAEFDALLPVLHCMFGMELVHDFELQINYARVEAVNRPYEGTCA